MVSAYQLALEASVLCRPCRHTHFTLKLNYNNMMCVHHHRLSQRLPLALQSAWPNGFSSVQHTADSMSKQHTQHTNWAM
jgi:hypothetical protein